MPCGTALEGGVFKAAAAAAAGIDILSVIEPVWTPEKREARGGLIYSQHSTRAGHRPRHAKV